MKRCPTCQLLYGNQRLKFCRYDGAPLALEHLLPEEPPTIRLSLPGTSPSPDDPTADKNRLLKETQGLKFDSL